jgi:hypothetical protein
MGKFGLLHQPSVVSVRFLMSYGSCLHVHVLDILHVHVLDSLHVHVLDSLHVHVLDRLHVKAHAVCMH